MQHEMVAITVGQSTMSSREIAELTCKEHKNVLQDIRKMLEELGETSAEFSADLPDSYGRLQAGYRLPKRETLILVSGYNIGMRARIVDRWQELESRAAPSFNLNDPNFLRSTLLTYTEKVLALQATITEQAPAVEFAHGIRNSRDAISMGDFAKVLGTGRNRFFDMLRGDHLLMADNKPYQQFIDRGYFRVIETSWTDASGAVHPTFKTLITGTGQVYLQRKYGARAGVAA